MDYSSVKIQYGTWFIEATREEKMDGKNTRTRDRKRTPSATSEVGSTSLSATVGSQTPSLSAGITGRKKKYEDRRLEAFPFSQRRG